MIYWNQILYTIGNYFAGLNILDILPDFHELYTFIDLPLELGGIRRKRRKTLEERVS